MTYLNLVEELCDDRVVAEDGGGTDVEDVAEVVRVEGGVAGGVVGDDVGEVGGEEVWLIEGQNLF